MNTPGRDIRTLFEVGSLNGLSDGQLLDRFVARRDEAAFEAIVRRHGPMVWGVCRRVLRDRHDAEDAFQATFLVLARKAPEIAHGEKVGNWLYGVSYRTATKARATRARRKGREGRMSDLPEPEASSIGRRDDRVELLDREIGRLPDRYRIPIVLCELEGKSHREAAEQLGWPIGTVSGRLSRARSMLEERLSRRGPVPSGGSLAALLAGDLASATVPMKLIGPLAHAASLVVSGQSLTAGVVPAEVAALAGEVLKTMILGKLKIVSATLLVAVAFIGGIGFAYRAVAAGDPGQEKAGGATEGKAIRIEESQPKPAKSSTAPVTAQEPAVDPMASYSFKIEPDDVYEFPELSIGYKDLVLRAGPSTVVPISTERGITGAMVIGKGTYRYTPERATPIEGQFRAAMVRFNPEEVAAIIPLGKGKKVNDRGVSEMSRHLLQVVIRHCWQSSKEGGRRQEVLIPPKGAFAAVLYTREHGDLLISSDERTATAFSFTDRKTLYKKK